MGFLKNLATALGLAADPEPAPAPVFPVFQPTAWHRIAYRYNPARMTREQMRSLSEDLFAAGLIGFPDQRLLALQDDTTCANWPGWNNFETQGELGGRRDWIGEIGARLAKGDPDPLYLNYLERLLGLLRRVEAARQEAERHWGPPADAIAVPAVMEPNWRPLEPAPARPREAAAATSAVSGYAGT